MRQWLSRTLQSWRRSRLGSASGPSGSPLGSPAWAGEFHNKRREPTSQELLRELKNTAYACASINASVCAAFPPRLFFRSVGSHSGQLPGKLPGGGTTRALPPAIAKAMARATRADRVDEVIDHPLLTLLDRVNPVHNLHDLLELTTLEQEIHGTAYWLIQNGPHGYPDAIWPLPAHLVTPTRRPESTALVDAYEYRVGTTTQQFAPSEIIAFRYPHPRDPYGPGLSPLRAVFEQISLSGDFLAFKQAIWGNVGLPGVIISPAEVLSDRERHRIEQEWNAKFRNGGQGRALVAESGLNVEIIQQSLGDLALLAEQAFTKEEIANAFGVPVAMLTKETNLSNLQASQTLHASLAIRPRLKRRDQKLNEQLVPRFDPTGNLFFQSDDPLHENADYLLQQQDHDLRQGVRTINEIRSDRGLDPVPWGTTPWLPLSHAPIDWQRRPDYAPRTGRNRNPDSSS
ncbi:phage portal protein [Tuwongella immobilis]|uniref:Phage portal protein n=1 Tax=Tuwongella immobilis TaxID=692036 RepID=A0A6C2YHT0_9BACT|nr:phage portal protein [Tuwongella immobilis]VIP00693.1 GATA Zn-finger-containing transcription factor OS=Singulisphaera acidiphila (strain ATCC BAA-1392 / DSM 18658 / VKM B-2454 / MOB10) GN=Sinac_4185 PE=4 SV=1: Phage_portal [Tuwongella immobilis]VTR96804.1 GATA Zn-finger-containing transcription factor OS=Singulisphaera acidiphila (strain ATCC BAA-1392 / DSM 18658 / VKM B-2454 / MOB10) GN=Sinac_4185 PE=4 SV=1: Phage_portal [Tuwongella immobilis]